jgi:hypothetical protein
MQLTPKTGGDNGSPTADCLIIEKVNNGFILRAIQGGEDEGVVQECRVYLDRSELLRDIAARL